MIHETQKDLISQNEATLEMVKSIKDLLKADEENQGAEEPPTNLAGELINKLGTNNFVG